MPLRTCLVPVLTFLSLSTFALADGQRQLDAHLHGVGSLDIAVEGTKVAMAFTAPGADIVGFEHDAATDEQRGSIEAAISDLAKPLDLFALPAAAECAVVSAEVRLNGEEDHDDHGHEEHAGSEEGDHAHEEHADADHDENDETHSEFRAAYELDCAAPDALDKIDFAYFGRFPNAEELRVQVVGASGAQGFDVHRDSPVMDLRGIF